MKKTETNSKKMDENIQKWKNSKEKFNEYMRDLDDYHQYDNLSDLLKLIQNEGMAGWGQK